MVPDISMLKLCCSWYPFAPWQVFLVLSYFRIVIVFSLSLPIYRNSDGTVFLIVSFQTIIPKLSVRYPPQTSISSVFLLHSNYFLVHFSVCPCIASAQITPSTYKRESKIECLQAMEMIPIRQIVISGPTVVGAGGPLLP